MLEALNALVEQYPWLAGISGFVNLFGFPVAVMIYYKLIAPKLARAKFINTELGGILKTQKTIEEREKVMQATMNILLKEVSGLKKGFLTAFTNSNLADSVKSLLHAILSGSVFEDPESFKEDYEHLTEEGKATFNEALNTIKEQINADERTALQKIQDELEGSEEERDDAA